MTIKEYKLALCFNNGSDNFQIENTKQYKVPNKNLYPIQTLISRPQIPAVKPWPQRKRSELSSQVETFVQNGSGGI